MPETAPARFPSEPRASARAALRAARCRVRFVSGSVVACLSAGCGGIVWQADLGGAQRQAARDGSLVLAYYSSPFNADCSQMEQTVFNNGDVIETMRGVLPVQLDALWHRKWAESLGIRTIPTFVLYGPDGQILNIRRGAMNEGQFRGFIVGGKLSR